jgi:MtfA peptidase
LPAEVLKTLQDSGFVVVGADGEYRLDPERTSRTNSTQDVTPAENPENYKSGGEWPHSLFGILLFLLVTFPILYLFKEILYLLFKKPFNSLILWVRYHPNSEEESEIINFLEQYSEYYKALNGELKKRFIRRFYKFYRLKTFDFHYESSRQKEDVFFVCKELTRITFGFSDFHLIDFTDFHFHADAYHLQPFNALAYGHTSDRGYLQLASNKMREGVINHDNGENLLLHELAHAVNIQKTSIDFDKRYNRIYESWTAFAQRHIDHVKNGGDTILRKYAFSNIDEMLAVNTEYFFERPQELKQELPEMYFFMRYLYNQNPLDKAYPLLDKNVNFRAIWNEFKLSGFGTSNKDEIAALESIRRRHNTIFALKLVGVFIVFSGPLFDIFHLTKYLLVMIIMILTGTMIYLVFEKVQIYKQIDAKLSTLRRLHFGDTGICDGNHYVSNVHYDVFG